MQLSGIKNFGSGNSESIPVYFLCGATIKNGVVDDNFFKNTSTTVKFTSIGSYCFYNCKNLKVINLTTISNSSGFSWGIDFSVLEELRLPSLALTSNLVSNEGSLKIVELKKAYINYSSKNSPTEKIISYQIPNLSNDANCFKYWNKDCILEIHDTTGIVSPRSGGYSLHPTNMTIKVPDSLLSQY